MVSKAWRRAKDRFWLQSEAHRVKVTFGIRVVTHSSAGEKVGLHASVRVHVVHDHFLLKAEWCASYPVFSQHVTSHLSVCVCVCFSAVSQPCGLRVRTRVAQWMRTQRWMSTSALIPHDCGICECVCVRKSYPRSPLTHTSGSFVRRATITWGVHVSVCRIRQQQNSDDREAQRK